MTDFTTFILMLFILFAMLTFLIGIIKGTTLPQFLIYFIATIILLVTVFSFRSAFSDLSDQNGLFMYFFKIAVAIVMLVLCPIYIIMDRNMGIHSVARVKYYAIDGVKMADWLLFGLFFAFWTMWGIGLGTFIYVIAGDYWPLIIAIIGLIFSILITFISYEKTPEKMAYCQSRDALIHRIKYLQDAIYSKMKYSLDGTESGNTEMYKKYLILLDDLHIAVKSSLYTTEIDVLEKRALNTINIIIDEDDFTEEGFKMISTIINEYNYGGRIR